MKYITSSPTTPSLGEGEQKTRFGAVIYLGQP